jgi:flavin reductase (DIM6/NTAB) family NADH-FMN oxidoreductase RutF
MVAFAAQQVAGTPKDSARNALATGEFTYNVVSRDLAEAMNASSIDLPPGESEFAFAGLTPLASEEVAAPRVAEAKATFECRVEQSLQLGTLDSGTTLVIGEVLRIHVDDAVLDGTRINAEVLETVGRMAGSQYASTADRFSLERPYRPQS